MSSSLGFKLSVAGGGTAATASAAAGGLYLSSSDATTETEEEPKAKDLKTKPKPKTQDSVEKVKKQIVAKLNKSSKPTQGSSVDVETIGVRYYLFLAATTIDSSLPADTKASYTEWWNQKFKLWQQEKNQSNLDSKFQGITKGYSDTETKALNKVCESVYKEKDPLDPATKTSTRTVGNLENNYWRYCSDLDEKPKSLIEAGEGASDNGHVDHYDAHGHVLAATGDQYNTKYWEIKNEWYLSLTTSEKDSTFETYVTGKGETVKENNKVSLRKVCKTTKGLNRDGDTLTPQIVVKYCGFSEHLYKNTISQ